jgi:hypothetical protein
MSVPPASGDMIMKWDTGKEKVKKMENVGKGYK